MKSTEAQKTLKELMRETIFYWQQSKVPINLQAATADFRLVVTQTKS